jgi:hypothetical protein
MLGIRPACLPRRKTTRNVRKLRIAKVVVAFIITSLVGGLAPLLSAEST